MPETETDAHTEPDHLVVGHLNKAHGIRGEIYVWALTDHPESTFSEGVELEVSDPAGEHPSDLFPKLRVERSRPYKKGYLVKFFHVDDRTEAERFRGRYLMRPMDEIQEPAEDELFYHELLGMEVETAGGESLGTVKEVFELEPSHLLEVRGAKGLLHIPFSSRVVTEVDVEGRRLVVDPPEGLLEQ